MTLNELISQAQLGDEPSIELLIRRFSHVIDRECARCGIWDDPELSHGDLVQDVLLHVWQKLDQFKGNELDPVEPVFRSWLSKTARSILMNKAERRGAQKRKPEKGFKVFDEATQAYVNRDSKTASSIFAAAEQADQLESFMQAKLDQKANQIIKMYIVDGHSFREIGEQLSMTYDQVRYSYKCSMKILEEELSEDDFGDSKNK